MLHIKLDRLLAVWHYVILILGLEDARTGLLLDVGASSDPNSLHMCYY